VVWTESIQTVLLLVGAVCITLVGYVKIGGWTALAQTLAAHPHPMAGAAGFPGRCGFHLRPYCPAARGEPGLPERVGQRCRLPRPCRGAAVLCALGAPGGAEGVPSDHAVTMGAAGAGGAVLRGTALDAQQREKPQSRRTGTEAFLEEPNKTYTSIDLENVGNRIKKQGVTYTTFHDLSQKTEVYQLIRGELARLTEAFPDTMKIKRFANLIKELHPDDGELTRTRKIRRSLVYERYQELIKDLYDGQEEHSLDIRIRFEDGHEAIFSGQVKIMEV
jgi:hypothetical protein